MDLKELDKLKPMIGEDALKILKDEFKIVDQVIQQVDEVFRSRVINEDNESIQKTLDDNIKVLTSNIVVKYVEMSLSMEALVDLPNLENILEWVQSSYTNILGQIFNVDFNTIVIEPALVQISEALVEFADENEPEKDNNETHN